MVILMITSKHEGIALGLGVKMSEVKIVTSDPVLLIACWPMLCVLTSKTQGRYQKTTALVNGKCHSALKIDDMSASMPPHPHPPSSHTVIRRSSRRT
ncbi:hypothetical protein PoB_001322800 [Plakobranchus ocellatus]|uniref:Uncharacterized protein n=1 Tax=Plakobranchus ocellatus TaxID=259542 RepID=A0AAV3YWV6_9GAST|nr:hypothetical protein PoB_001322800 [Plakobranchus ocellatus]